ncbi:hypothetical protein [Rhodoferax fermentans]|uniref:Uncharacterized protein n=1 Tax=Rhodoferax fermentans TaxID=28066 RepID=A0A1T1ANT5_RHOFE|nr:hypothetical protein [Rhodoferax fermentans]OOV05769.1 hypothetical protein RF819_02755 [Rhodoferax fermentans]
MAVKNRTRGAQYPLVAEYVFNFNDGQAFLSALNGASVDQNPKSNVTDFGSGVQPDGMLSGVTYVTGGGGKTSYFEVLALPINAQVIGGDVHVENAYVGPATATVQFGDAVTGSWYSAAIDAKTAARTALTLPLEDTDNSPTHAATGLDLRMALVLGAGNATAGRVRVRVMYTIDGRINEVSAS